MTRAVYIKRFICCFIFLVFALSITPKRYLHTLFASHTDKQSGHADGPYQLSVSGYNCDNNDTVANSVFTGYSNTLSVPVIIAYQPYIFLQVSLVTSGKIFHSLRGPPAC